MLKEQEPIDTQRLRQMVVDHLPENASDQLIRFIVGEIAVRVYHERQRKVQRVIQEELLT